MDGFLDQVARTMATGGSRREMLRRVGGGLAAAVLASVGLAPREVQAARCPPGTIRCQAGGPCCLGTCCGAAGACCAGCCNQNICRPGTLGQECGRSGGACAACATPNTCVRQPGGGGTCQAAGTCGPGNCTGCCSGSTCVEFVNQTLANCGGGGNACVACSPGFICTAGVCMFMV